MSRKTVAKVIAEHQQQRVMGTTGLPAPHETRGSLVDPYEETPRDYLARYPDISVVRLLEELRRQGYTGGYTILRERVRQLRPHVGLFRFSGELEKTKFDQLFDYCLGLFGGRFGRGTEE